MKNRRKLVCVQGLGFVGAAMAAAVALAKNKGGDALFDVVGVDLPDSNGQGRVNAINQGKFPFATNDEKLVNSIKHARDNGNLSATTKESIYSNADIVIVDVALDINTDLKVPRFDFDTLRRAIRTLGRKVGEGTLIIVETTVPPGTCEKIVLPTLKEELRKRKMLEDSVLVAHSFERVMPGSNYLASIVNFWRVFSGCTPEAADACEKFLSKIINVDVYPLTRLQSTRASETAKLMENTYRAVNIAFIDEWTRYAEEVDLDLFEIIEAIRRRPSHANIRVPGLGVGGYCLTKDPLFVPVAVKQIWDNDDLSFPFSHLAIEINQGMPSHSINRLSSMLGGVVKNKQILMCGVGYKQDIGDTRYSPSEVMLKSLEDLGAQVTSYDPFVDYWMEVDRNLPDKLPDPSDFDAIIFTVPHQQFLSLDLVDWIGKARPVILDTVNVFDKVTRDSCRAMGIRIESIGRGDGL